MEEKESSQIPSTMLNQLNKKTKNSVISSLHILSLFNKYKTSEYDWIWQEKSRLLYAGKNIQTYDEFSSRFFQDFLDYVVLDEESDDYLYPVIVRFLSDDIMAGENFLPYLQEYMHDFLKTLSLLTIRKLSLTYLSQTNSILLKTKSSNEEIISELSKILHWQELVKFLREKEKLEAKYIAFHAELLFGELKLIKLLWIKNISKTEKYSEKHCLTLNFFILLAPELKKSARDFIINQVKIYLTAGAEKGKREKYIKMLELSAENGEFEVFKFCCEYIKQFSDNYLYFQHSLNIAAERGNQKLVDYLLDNRLADINGFSEDNLAVLDSAIFGGSIEILNYLLKKGVDVPEKVENYPSGKYKLQDSKLTGVEKVNKTISFALVKNLSVSADKKVQIWKVTAGFDVVTVKLSQTPEENIFELKIFSLRTQQDIFHQAIKFGELNIVELLCSKYKLDVNKLDTHGMAAIHYLAVGTRAEGNYKKLFVFLRKKGLNINRLDQSGMSALQMAMQWGDIETVNMFIKDKANVLIKGENHRTLLHLWAIRYQRASREMPDINLLTRILQAGADPLIKDASGKGVKDYIKTWPIEKKPDEALKVVSAWETAVNQKNTGSSKPGNYTGMQKKK